MGILGSTLGAPVALPLLGLGWLARRLAETALQELDDPAKIEAELLALERSLTSGEISEAAFEQREAALLDHLARLQAAQAPGAGAAMDDDDGRPDPPA
jgi:glucose-6-phosphate dehydrogenase assembly protein OpcA